MAQKLTWEDSAVREILHTFDSRIAQIYANIKNVYPKMTGAKAYSVLVSATQMLIIREDLSNHHFVKADGIMELSTDLRKILASSPFSEALFDKQMTTVFDIVGQDEASPTITKPTQDVGHLPVNTLFCYYLPPSISVHPLNEPGRSPMDAGGGSWSICACR